MHATQRTLHRLLWAAVFLLTRLPLPGSALLDNLSGGRNQVVVVYGTSLTEGGRWTTDIRDWLTQTYPGQVTFYNSGMSGRASNTGVVSLQSRVLDLQPDVVFLEFSMNDAFEYAPGGVDSGITVAKSKENLNTMIDAILAARPDCEIFLQTMNPAWDAPNGNMSGSRRPNLLDYYEGYREVAAARDLPLIDHYVNWALLRSEQPAKFETYVPDGVHPSSAGSTAITTPEIKLALLPPPNAAPATPTNLTVTATDGTAVLAWTASEGAGSYRVERATAFGGPFSVTAGHVTVQTYVDNSVATDTTYYYRVVAVNNLGESAPTLPRGVTTPGPASVLDNADTTDVTITGTWLVGAVDGYYGKDYIYAQANSGASIRFAADVPSSGRYAVHARWTASSNRATNAPFEVVHADGSNVFYLNQRINHATWVLLGTFDFEAGGPGYVELTTGGANGFLLADAVRFTPEQKPLLGVSVKTETVREDSGGSIGFSITRRDANGTALVVRYQLGGTATQGTDYAPAVGSITLPVGVDEATLVLTPASDSVVEGDETVVCSLLADAAYEVGAEGSAQAVLKDRPFDSWRHVKFTPSELADPDISGDLADPDADGLSNLAEYAFGDDPMVAGSATPVPGLSDARLMLSYPRFPEGQGIRYIPEVSDDLEHWFSGSIYLDDVFVRDLGDGHSLHQAIDIPPAGTPTPRFMRIRIEPE